MMTIIRNNLNRLTTAFLLCSVLGTAQPTFAKPTSPGLLQQAQTAQKQGHYPKAVSLWQQVVKQNPKSAEAYYNLGVCLHHEFQLLAAIAAYQNATRLNPKYDDAYINLGLALIEVNQYDAAIAALQKVLTLPDRPGSPASTHTLAHYNLAIIFRRQGKRSDALREVQQTLKLNPKFIPAQTLLRQMRG